MNALQQLFANNRAWAERIRSEDPQFFPRLSRLQRGGALVAPDERRLGRRLEEHKPQAVRSRDCFA